MNVVELGFWEAPTVTLTAHASQNNVLDGDHAVVRVDLSPHQSIAAGSVRCYARDRKSSRVFGPRIVRSCATGALAASESSPAAAVVGSGRDP